MARECFCGCGLRVGWVNGRISKRGASVLRMVEELKLYDEPLREGADAGSESCRQGLEMLEEFCNEGEFFADQLRWVVHGECPAQDVDHRQLTAWQRTGAKLRGIFIATLK